MRRQWLTCHDQFNEYEQKSHLYDQCSSDSLLLNLLKCLMLTYVFMYGFTLTHSQLLWIIQWRISLRPVQQRSSVLIEYIKLRQLALERKVSASFSLSLCSPFLSSSSSSSSSGYVRMRDIDGERKKNLLTMIIATVRLLSERWKIIVKSEWTFPFVILHSSTGERRFVNWNKRSSHVSIWSTYWEKKMLVKIYTVGEKTLTSSAG